MYIIVLGIILLKLQTSVSQYPKHMDFQKVGEVIFNNEKFNILKPTTHIISDYFKQFMLRTSDSNFPTKRIFIDDNGLRHFWTGFGKKTRSLRKTDEIDTNFIDNTETAYKNKAESKEKATVGNENMTTTARTTTKENDNNSNQNDKHSNEVSENQDDHTENKNSVEKHSEEEDIVSTTLKSLLYKKKRLFRSGSGEESLRNDKKNDKSKPTTKAAAAKKSTTKKGKTEENATTSANTGKKEDTKKKGDTKKSSNSDKVVATTTFFCPFFGVITMSAFVD